ncbi:MAG: hypothetical protein U1C55_00700, partial [Smithellaceae bacterium]|nr:hypothetical protein [Smithellaceae bacterium]
IAGKPEVGIKSRRRSAIEGDDKQAGGFTGRCQMLRPDPSSSSEVGIKSRRRSAIEDDDKQAGGFTGRCQMLRPDPSPSPK